jgi:hypothetical protein
MKIKIHFEELEFGGSGDPYIEVLGCLRHPLATTPQISIFKFFKFLF